MQIVICGHTPFGKLPIASINVFDDYVNVD